jgi:hypothetical protein
VTTFGVGIVPLSNGKLFLKYFPSVHIIANLAMLTRREEGPKDWEDEYRRLKETHKELQIISNVNN